MYYTKKDTLNAILIESGFDYNANSSFLTDNEIKLSYEDCIANVEHGYNYYHGNDRGAST